MTKTRGVNKPHCLQRTDNQNGEKIKSRRKFPFHCWKLTANPIDRRRHYRDEPAGTDEPTASPTVLNVSQIAAYEREICELREELLKEIGHLEKRKEEAVKAAASCSPEHFQNLQEQFFSKWLCRQRNRWFNILRNLSSRELVESDPSVG